MVSQVITLTTDFGYQDPFVGIMKGVILGINPAVTLVDLTHGIEPQNIMAGALSLTAAVGYFPRGTIHLVVVDPGVGSNRKPIVIETETAFLVGPDNGVLSLSAQMSHVSDIVELSNTRYHLKPTSSTFHGRDIFSPAAAHISMGVPLRDLGKALRTYTSLDLPRSRRSQGTVTGQIIYIDHFGNLISNIRHEDLAGLHGELDVTIHRTTIRGISTSYSTAAYGAYLAIFNSWGFLEIARCNGNARLGMDGSEGSVITVRTREARTGD